MLRKVDTQLIEDAVAKLCISSNRVLPDDLLCKIESAEKDETSPLGKDILCDLKKNVEAAAELSVPICQDTGMAVVFIELGQDVHLVGKPLNRAVNCGVSRGYTDGLLRKSVVADPLRRVNTNDNTPAVLHLSMVSGDRVKITVAPKGFGSENMSRLYMLTPASGEERIIELVASTVKEAGGNPCPPLVIGVGIGGDFELCALLAKRALCRDVSKANPDPYYAELERKILAAVNETNVGPQGFGGKTTALSVAVETYATHIAGLPLAVNIGCHVTRHETTVI